MAMDCEDSACLARAHDMRRAAPPLACFALAGALLMAACAPNKAPGTAPTPSASSAARATAAGVAPKTTSSASVAPATKVAMEVHITSSAPSQNPDASQPKNDGQVANVYIRADKLFWNHRLRISGNEAKLEHPGLKKKWVFPNGEKVADLARRIDWKAVAVAAGKAPPQEGGTVFQFAVKRGDEQYTFQVLNVDAHPNLRQLMGMVHQLSGVP